MEEDLADVLQKTAEVLHWLGKHQAANACMLCARLVSAKQITTLDELEVSVCKIEEASSANCTGVAATWCPIHGDCECIIPDDPEEPVRDDKCSLHSPSSMHAEGPAHG